MIQVEVSKGPDRQVLSDMLAIPSTVVILFSCPQLLLFRSFPFQDMAPSAARAAPPKPPLTSQLHY